MAQTLLILEVRVLKVRVIQLGKEPRPAEVLAEDKGEYEMANGRR